MSTTVRVYVVDDHPVVREGLLKILSADAGFDVVGHAGSGDIALCELRARNVDVVVVDHVLEDGIQGMELLRRLTSAPYSLRCVVLTSSQTPDELRAVLAQGASGVLSKSASPEAITAAVRSAAAGHTYFDPRVLTALVELPTQTRVPNEAFDMRDRVILRSLAAGRSNREIAATLHVSAGSVKKYVSTLLRKLEVSHRTSAVAVAAERGLLDTGSGQVATRIVASWD